MRPGARPHPAAEHLNHLVANLIDPRGSESARAGHARTLADHTADLQRSVEVATATLSGSVLVDLAREGATGVDPTIRNQARSRNEQRRELRAVESITRRPVILDPAPETGLPETAPLIRIYAREFDSSEVYGSAPVLPGLPVVSSAAAVNPTLPLPTEFDQQDPPQRNVYGQQVTIADVGAERRWDFAAAYVNISRQLLDFASEGAAALLDGVITDALDLAAEEHVVAELEAAGTAAADVTSAEAAAGAAGRGACRFLICSPERWPDVRAEVATSWQGGPHPIPIISAGAVGVTLVGPNAMEVLVTEVESFTADEPRVFGRATGLARSFRLLVRDPAAIRVAP